MFRFLLLAFGLVFLLHLSIHAQTLDYEVIKNDEQIGTLRTQRQNTAQGGIILRVDTDVNFSFFGKQSLTVEVESHFTNTQLAAAHTAEKLNEKMRNQTRLEWDGTHYFFTNDDGERKCLGKECPQIAHTVTSMYYNEPKDLNRVFSERHGEFLTLKSIGKNQYELHMPNGRKNLYTYKDGICQRVDVDHWFADFSFVRK